LLWPLPVSLHVIAGTLQVVVGAVVVIVLTVPQQ
jgi:hypothetical protein